LGIYNETIKSLQSELLRLQSESSIADDRSSERVNTLQSQVDHLNSVCKSLRDRNQELQYLERDLVTKLDDYELRIKQLESEKSSLQSKMSNQLTQLQKQLQLHEQEWEIERSELQNQLKGMELKNLQIKERADTLNQQLNQLNRLKQDIQEALGLTSTPDTSSILAETAKSTLEELQKLKSDTQKLYSEFQRVEKRLQDKTNAYNVLHSEMQTLMQDHEQALTKLEEMTAKSKNKQHYTANSVAASAESRMVEEGVVNNNNSLVASLKGELEYLKEENRKMQDRVHETAVVFRSKYVSMSEYTALSQIVDELQEKCRQLKSEINQATLDLSSERFRAKDFSQTISQLDLKITAKDTEVQKLLQVVDEYKRHLWKMEEFYGETIRNREKDIQLLRKELDRLPLKSTPLK
jgi:chromosome segregation ATPase